MFVFWSVIFVFVQPRLIPTLWRLEQISSPLSDVVLGLNREDGSLSIIKAHTRKTSTGALYLLAT